MKKVFWAVAAIAMLATACTKDDSAVVGNESLVSFTIDSPELTTRYGEGTTATTLQWAFYDETGKQLTNISGEKTDFGGSHNFTVELVDGRQYTALFWASAPDAPYTVDWSAKTMTINKDMLTANNEAYDAFYKYYEVDLSKRTHRIELTRPFAQINIATADTTEAKAAGVEVKSTKVAVVQSYQTLDFVSGEVSNPVDFTFKWNAKATGEVEVNKKAYQLLAMNYVLVHDRELVNVTLRISENDKVAASADDESDLTRTYTTVPVQRNYRTHIVGNLLTTNNTFEVITDPRWAEPNIEYTEIADGVVLTSEGEYLLSNAEGWKWFAKDVTNGNTFEGKVVKLANDIDLFQGYMEDGDPITTAPVGKRDNTYSNAFKGTFDGQDHIIKNLYQNGWALNYKWGAYGAIGLFARVDNATIKNLVVEDCEVFVEGGNVAVIAGNAVGDCTFENITINSGVACSYNNGVAGIVAWSETGNYTFKDIVLGEDFTVASFWGAHGTYCGGVLAEAYADSSYLFEDITINCRIDAYNDVCSNYQWWAYRVSGMVVGNVETSQVIVDKNYPDPAGCNITCKNVVVNYGDWMHYHYCESENFGKPSYADPDEWKFKRVEAGYSYDGIDHTQCNHDTTDESHYVYIPFDQLFGGGQNGDGRSPVYGLASFPGVTVNYPYSYNKEVSTASDLHEAIKAGKNVKLAADVDMGTTQLALDNVKIDLNGKTLTTANNWGGMSLKNGASIKNGTINHTGNTAAIKAFNVGAIENVTINTTCATADKTVTAIAIQQGGHVGTIKDVTINGVSQGIEVGYQATVDLIDNANVTMHTNGTAKGIGLVINGGKVGKAVNSTFKGDVYGVTMHLKGIFDVNLELENCQVEGATASINAWDEKGISNTSGSLTLTYDAATTLNGPFVWDFEDECKSVVTLNQPQ